MCHGTARIESTFTEEIPTIKQKFLGADYPPRFANSAIKQFNEKCNGNTQDDYIILPDFFDVPKPLVLAEIPHCPRNETLSKRFIKKFHIFTTNSHKIRIKRIAKKAKQLFKLKSKNPHPSCVIYEGVCVCEQIYIGEMRHNVELQWEEHENTFKDSEPAKHLKENLNQKFSWKIFFATPENKQIHKVLEASEIVLKRPSLNNKLNLKSFCYFVMVWHENFITFNCNYLYIKYFNHYFNFCVSKSFYYSTNDVLLQKAFTDILNCCDIHFTYILSLF